MAFEPLKIKDLRLGMYVELKCSWFRHPFASKTFKVTSVKDLEAIKKIPQLHLYYDPDLSDPDSLPSSETLEEPAPILDSEKESPVLDSEKESLVLDSDASKEEISPPTAPPTEADKAKCSWEEKKIRVEAFRERRAQLIQTEGACFDLVRMTQIAFRKLLGGGTVGLSATQDIYSTLCNTLNENRALMSLLEIMSATEANDTLFFHNFNVCVLSALVGKEMGLSEKDLQWLVVGALYHDVGFKNIPRDLHLTPGGFVTTPTNSKHHVKQGIKVSQQFPDFPKESLAVISQHHERLNGTGYPLGLQGDGISLFAKIVMVVDEYDYLCNGSERGKNMVPNKALSYLYKNEAVKRKGEFSQDVIIGLIRALGVYPPGTFVELNDGVIGVVVGVNPQIRAKPQVMTYAPELPKDEVTIIDLAQDEDVSIQRCLRPEELSRKIRRALSPQRFTGHTLSTMEGATLSPAWR